MTTKKSGFPWTKGAINGLTNSISFLLAGLEGGLNEYSLQSLALQRLDTGGFRCVLKGFQRGGSTDAVQLVAFTNAELASECLLYLETAFADDSLRWHVDRFAKGLSDDDAGKTKKRRLTPRK